LFLRGVDDGDVVDYKDVVESVERGDGVSARKGG
jgi:hypothetical protein